MENNYQRHGGPSANYQDQGYSANSNTSDLYEYNNQQQHQQNQQHQQHQQPQASQQQSEFKQEVTDMLCSQVNQALVVPKAFYFFFFAAFGSLFPLMAIYFKQMAMSPMQVGFLFGLKPFVEFFSAPFWGHVGSKWRQAKLIFLFSLLCWIGFTLGLGLIHPPVHSCLMHNETHIFFSTTADQVQKNNVKRDLTGLQSSDDSTSGLIRVKRADPKPDEGIGKQWRVVNVTRIVRYRKTTTTTTTKKLEHIVDRPGGSGKADVEDNTSGEQIVSDGKQKDKSTSSSTKTKFDEAKDAVVSQILTTSKPQNYAQSAINNAINDMNNEKVSSASTLAPPKKNLPVSSPTTSKTSIDDLLPKLPISLDLATKSPDPKKVEIKNFFDKGDLESAKSKGKIVYLDQPDLNLIKPSLETSVVYHRDDVQHIFLIFLFFILAGEFFSAPAITLADQCTLSILGPSRADLYGRQRMFGSIGWAISMFSVSMVLDNARIFTNHPCGIAGPDERNYNVCFAIFAVLMGFAFVVATQFQFEYGDEEGIPLKSMASGLKKKITKNNPQFNPQILVNDEEEPGREPTPPKQQQHHQLSEEGPKLSGSYMEVLKICKSVKLSLFLFVVWFMGIGVGLVFTFLFWHLQDLGGSPTLYGIASVINHVSELMAYFFVNQLIRKYGHIQIFYAGLLGNTLRFMYVSVLTDPIWILPFEFIQGLTHAMVWAAASSYFAQSIPADLRPTAQSLLNSIHFGLGRGFGALLGGGLFAAFGGKVAFFLYGFSCFVICGVYMIVNSKINAEMLNQTVNNNEYINQQDFNNENIPDFQNVTNPMLNDTNVYYQSDRQSGSENKTSFPVMAPHGVPSPNHGWNNQFINNPNTRNVYA